MNLLLTFVYCLMDYDFKGQICSYLELKFLDLVSFI